MIVVSEFPTAPATGKAAAKLPNVTDGIILTLREDGGFNFYRVNGTAGMGKILVQKAECCRYPASLGNLVWDNYMEEYPENISIHGVLVK